MYRLEVKQGMVDASLLYDFPVESLNASVCVLGSSLVVSNDGGVESSALIKDRVYTLLESQALKWQQPESPRCPWLSGCILYLCTGWCSTWGRAAQSKGSNRSSQKTVSRSRFLGSCTLTDPPALKKTDPKPQIPSTLCTHPDASSWSFSFSQPASGRAF